MKNLFVTPAAAGASPLAKGEVARAPGRRGVGPIQTESPPSKENEFAKILNERVQQDAPGDVRQDECRQEPAGPAEAQPATACRCPSRGARPVPRLWRILAAASEAKASAKARAMSCPAWKYLQEPGTLLHLPPENGRV
jgi:hypothetical protein